MCLIKQQRGSSDILKLIRLRSISRICNEKIHMVKFLWNVSINLTFPNYSFNYVFNHHEISNELINNKTGVQ